METLRKETSGGNNKLKLEYNEHGARLTHAAH